MKHDSNSVIGHKIKMVFAWLVLLGDFTSGILAFVVCCRVFPKLLHVGDKLNQTGIDALIRIEKDFALVALGISMVLIANSVLIFFLLRELKLNANKPKPVRAGDNL